jgi:hypothetical protein
LTEKEEELLDESGSGVEEFEDEGDFGYDTEVIEDCDSDALALDELTSTPSTNYYDFLLQVCMNQFIPYNY